MTPITVNHLIFDILFDYITPKVHRTSASRYRSRVAIMLTHNIRWGYIRARVKEENRIERRRRRRRRKGQPRVPISPDRSLDRGFANNGALARGAFFRWRLDTYRIYILLLLLGKRSSAERLFNTTRSLSGLFYDREDLARGEARGPLAPIKAKL